MEDVVYYSELYDIYKELLTEKQKKYFEDYYFNNLSFSEISENYQVSRNAVYRQVSITKSLLEEYEDKLNLLYKKNEIEKLLDSSDICRQIKNIIDSD